MGLWAGLCNWPEWMAGCAATRKGIEENRAQISARAAEGVKEFWKVFRQDHGRVGANRSGMMQIGSNFQANPLSLLRPLAGGEVTAQTGTGASASVQGGRGHGHHHPDRVRHGEGGDEARMQGRLQRMAAMLERLTEQNPDAQGASYAAIVMGGKGGAMAVASTPAAGGMPGDTLIIQAQSISEVTTSAGDDTVTLRGATVSGIYTGAGSDTVSIVGSFVSGIHTDAAGPEVAPPSPPPPAEPDSPVVAAPAPEVEVAEGQIAVPPDVAEVDTSGSATLPVVGAGPVVAGNDALAIAAFLINDIATGGGDDALALAGRIVTNVDAGAGDDAVAIRAKVVTGVTGGDGNDAIAVDAGVGVAGVSNAAAWFATAAEPVVATNGDVTAQVGAAAARAYADVDGGAGNDVISVRTASVLAVAGGMGDDTINAVGGTLSLVYGAGDGNDTVNVAAGAQVVLQIAEDAGPYTVEFGEDSMTVKMGEGSVTFSGIGAGTVGIKQGDGGMALITRPGASLNQTM